MANAAGLLLGRTDSPLTDRGRAQVSALGRSLGKVSRVVTSPLIRARETAGALGLDVPVEVDERWIEVDYGSYEGRSVGKLAGSDWARRRRDPNIKWTGGESLADVGRRVREACEDLFAEEGSGARAEADVVVVSHVSPIKAAVAWALGTGDEVAWRLYLATASLTRIAWGTDAPVLRSYNEVALHDEPAPLPT